MNGPMFGALVTFFGIFGTNLILINLIAGNRDWVCHLGVMLIWIAIGVSIGVLVGLCAPREGK